MEIEFENLNQKPVELNEDALGQVSGGVCEENVDIAALKNELEPYFCSAFNILENLRKNSGLDYKAQEFMRDIQHGLEIGHLDSSKYACDNFRAFMEAADFGGFLTKKPFLQILEKLG